MYQPLVAYNHLTRAPRSEHQDVSLPIERGELPRELVGVLFRNGPGSMESYGVPYEHLFDGDGYVQRIAFDGRAAHYTARFVETSERRIERAAGRPRFRSFGTNLPGGIGANALRFHFKNAANTSILPIGTQLLALWEGGSPYLVDATTLQSTATQWTNGGMLLPQTAVERMMGVGRPFSAHPKFLAGRGEILNFGMLPGREQRVMLYRLPATPAGAIDATPSERSGTVHELILPRLSFAHDVPVLADGRRLFFDIPVAFRLMRTFFGIGSPVAGIGEDYNRPTTIRLIDDRDPDSAPTQQLFETDPLYVFHFPNSFTRNDGTMVVDACRMDHFPSAADIRLLMNGTEPDRPFSAQLTRFEIDPVSGLVRSHPLSDWPMELPTINPAYRNRDYRYVWGVADRPDRGHSAALHGIARFDLHSGQERFVDFYPGFAGEPLFVPRPGATEEDDGWLLVLAVDVEAAVSRLHVIDAATMEESCRLALPEVVHVGFHGIWQDATTA